MLSDTHIKTIENVISVKGEEVEIKSNITICNKCGQRVFNQDVDGKNLELAYSIYRKKHNLLSPTEIVNTRQKYSLSQRALAKLLEWGEITINRYETGSIQDSAHNEVLRFIAEPKNMREIYENNNQFLSESVREKLGKRIDALIEDELKPQLIASLEDYISFNKLIDEYSGFADFNLEKIMAMIQYIAEKTKGVFTTKLNKLLWYSDFLNFRTYSKSISGCAYVHLPLGPVPDNWRWIIAATVDEELIKGEEVIFKNYAGEQYTACLPTDESFFNESEKKVMDFVIDYFEDFTSDEIKERSHKENAYQKTGDNEKISYKFATSLSIKL